MGRLACLVVKTASGEFLDGVTGKPVACVVEGAGVTGLVEQYRHLRSARVIKRGKEEVGIAEIRMLANHTAGGELKAACKFR